MSKDYKTITLEEVLKRAQEIKENLDTIRAQWDCVVTFVDLVGSTKYKEEHPNEEEWLPRLAYFLNGVTQIISETGRVVKYIGDEVMAVFDGNSATMKAEHACERILEFCARSSDYELNVKIAIDYGPVSFLDFKDIPRSNTKILSDPQGVTVDRCSRIMTCVKPGVVLCSESFRRYTRTAIRWKYKGRFKAKGILDPVKVYQLQVGDLTEQFELESPYSLEECQELVRELKAKIDDIKMLHK